MWSKKYWRVQLKLATRKLKRSPHNTVYTVMGLSVFSLCSIFAFNHFKQSALSNVSTFTKWQKVQVELAPSRRPASTKSYNCSYENTNLAQIRKEVRDLEKKYQTGSIIEGTVFGINLANLPSIAAQLLADNKSLIGDQTKDYNFSQCKTIPCVFNQLYKDESQLTGHYIYYWYLKTGSIISSTNYIPNQSSHIVGNYNNRPHSFDHYLFTQEELKNFYFLAKSLPEKLTYIPLLKSIHKIPNGSSIEDNKNCSLALPNGQILLTNHCLRSENNEFFINVTTEIAKYTDRQEGLKNNLASLSSDQKWIDQSLWFKESYFNPQTHQYTYKWDTQLPKSNFLTKKSLTSPSEQLASLIANYRFNPSKFKSKTPLDIAGWVKSDFFHNKSFDSRGLYYLYLNSSLDEWSKQESKIWNDCIGQYLKEEDLNTSNRNLASTLEHPLYSCVERKIPGFIDHTVTKIQKDSFEGCKFFNDHNMYGHVSEKFFTSVNKFLSEKVLKRKIEIQKHGKEVLIGQQIKQEFISTIDPKTLYISCFNELNNQYCFENSLQKMLNKIFSKNETVSEYYRSVISEDILSLYPYSSVKLKTNEAAKMFLAPYNTRLTQAATKLWDSCKIQGMDHTENINLPMKFSGGRYYINAKLINCINKKLDNEIFELAKLTAFHKNSDGRVEFRLNSKEQKFALSFLEGNLLQTLNNILDKEFLSEKIMFNDHFRRSKITALGEFSKRSDFIEGIFSDHQVTSMCLKEVKKFYPENYFYHAKSDVDKTFGRKICSSFVTMPTVRDRISTQVQDQWARNKELAQGFLTQNYASLVSDCRSDYPDLQGYAKAKNAQLRNTCIRLSYNQALSEAMADWKSHKHYKYFYNKKPQLQSFLDSKRNLFINKALQNQQI